MAKRAVDVAGTGFTVLDRVYADDADPFEALGGSCGNVLVSLALLNRSVAPVIALGCDDVGDALSVEFQEAGADTRYIFRSHYIASPILIQLVDTLQGQHEFSFVCPDTAQDFPRFTPIEPFDVGRSLSVLSQCAIFFADRLSEAIVSAMEIAAASGACVYFEPSEVGDPDLFRRALGHTSILKYSSERFPAGVDDDSLPRGAVSIITHGGRGLEVRAGAASLICPAAPAAIVRDTSGSGDMVTVGVIDRLLSIGRGFEPFAQIHALLPGVVAGQRLAAANCAFTGARGLFRQHGPGVVRSILDGLNPSLDGEMEPSLF